MSDVRWEGFTHQEIYDAVMRGPGAAASTPAVDAWTRTEGLIQRIDQRITAAINGSQGGWEGSAADTTRSAMTPLGQWALDAANDAKITAEAVRTQGVQAEKLRADIPPPLTEQRNAEMEKALTDPTYFFHGLDDLQRIDQQVANDGAIAVDLMNRYTSDSYVNRRNMDFWTLPPQVTVVTDGAAPGPAGPGVSAVPGGPAPTPPADVAVPPPGGTAPVPPTGPPPAVVPPGPPTGAPPGAPGAAPTAPPIAQTPAAPIPPAVVPSAPGQPGAFPPGTGPVAAPAVPAAPTGPGVPPAPGITPPPGTSAIPPLPPGAIPAARPVVPGQPRPVPLPSWRDVVPAAPPAPGTRFPGLGAADRNPALPPGPRTTSEPLGARAVSEPSARAAAAAPPAGPRAGGPGAMGGMYPPFAAGLGNGAERERRRPDYLLDDSDAFVDDRWFTPAVITPDDGPPARQASRY